MEKNKEIKISIVIRTYNEEKNIFACLNALKNQAQLPDEVIIVDNESNDSTLKIVQEIKNILPFSLKILNNPVRGYSSGLNLGIENAKYDWVGFLSADCFPDSQWLLGLLSVIKDERLLCSVVQGREVPRGDNEVMYVLFEETKNKCCGIHKIKYFYNTNIIYNVNTLKKFLPFSGIDVDGGVEDILMSIKYDTSGLNVYQNDESFVYHQVYDSLCDFKIRTIKHSATIIPLLFRFPFRPRLYLNSFYWSLVEVLLGVKRRKKVFVKIGFLRICYTVLGMLHLNYKK